MASATIEKSGKEEIVEWIQQFYPVLQLTLETYNFDLYISELKLIVQYSELSTFINMDRKECIAYHINRLQIANKNGYRLITIYEDEWRDRKKQIQSVLKSVFNKNENRLFARKLDLKIVPKLEAQTFLDDTHIQGHPSFNVCFGLYQDGELLGVATGNKHHRQGMDHIFVLNRLAFKYNTSVAGGSSKLIKALVDYAKNSGFELFISWSDNRWSEGNVYKTLGFERVEDLPADYSYIVNGDHRVSKQSCQKKNLRKRPGCIEGTELEMSLSLGYHRVFDCGKIRWSIKL